MGEYLLAISDFDQEMERKSLSDISLFCLFLSNLIYSLNLTRYVSSVSLGEPIITFFTIHISLLVMFNQFSSVFWQCHNLFY